MKPASSPVRIRDCPQVRLWPHVNDALRKLADRDSRSITNFTNLLLMQALGLTPPTTPPEDR